MQTYTEKTKFKVTTDLTSNPSVGYTMQTIAWVEVETWANLGKYQ